MSSAPSAHVVGSGTLERVTSEGVTLCMKFDTPVPQSFWLPVEAGGKRIGYLYFEFAAQVRGERWYSATQLRSVTDRPDSPPDVLCGFSRSSD